MIAALRRFESAASGMSMTLGQDNTFFLAESAGMVFPNSLWENEKKTLRGGWGGALAESAENADLYIFQTCVLICA